MRTLIISLLLAAPVAVANDQAKPDSLELGHFRPAAGHIDATFRCGATTARAQHEVLLEEGVPRSRLASLAGSRALTAAELSSVNERIAGQGILGIGVGCLGDSVQFTISTWNPTTAKSGAVMVTIADDGELKLL